MKHPASVLILALCLQPAAVLVASADQAESVERVVHLVRKHCPDAEIVQDDRKMSAKDGTMMFTIHPRLKTGEVLKKTVQVEGPNFRGFLLQFSVVEGKYHGAAEVPQTFHDPYWQTYFDCPQTEDGDGYYRIRFSYGSRLDKDFKKAVFQVFTATRASAPNATTPP